MDSFYVWTAAVTWVLLSVPVALALGSFIRSGQQASPAQWVAAGRRSADRAA